MNDMRTQKTGNGPATLSRAIPSERIRRSRAFVSLSNRLNALHDEYAVARESLDRLAYALEAKAALIAFLRPVGLLYTKYNSHSESLQRCEFQLQKDENAIPDILSSSHQDRVISMAGLTFVPLMWRDDIVGLLAFDLDRRKLTPHEQSSIVFLANHLSAMIGLQSGERFAASGPNVTFARKDLEDAAAVQQSLFPRVPEQCCGLAIAADTQAADLVGGDYFDLVLLDRNKIGIVIADVEGKGVAAALFGNVLRSTVHFLTRETPSTAAVMEKLNSILHRDGVSSQKLFSMFYATYDAEEKLLTYSGSGHVCPIVVRASDKTSERLYSDGTLVGVNQQQRSVERSLQMCEGDIIVFFTDGFIEHANGDGEPFGDRRLIQILREEGHKKPEDILRGIKHCREEFSPLPAVDDSTILVAKIL